MSNDWCAKRRRARAAASAVLSNPDLVACILRHTGPSTFAVASQVCHAWLVACRYDESVLRAVALYQGGLNKAKLTHLFAISWREADALPRTKHARAGGGAYFVYREPAVDSLLSRGGMAAWRQRLRARAESPWSPFVLWPTPPCPPRRAPWQEEERLHLLESQSAVAAAG